MAGDYGDSGSTTTLPISARSPTTSDSDRFAGTGVLSPDDARALGCLGGPARAGGLVTDARLDHPTIDLPVTEVGVTSGDVLARCTVRRDEFAAAATLVAGLVTNHLGRLTRAKIVDPSWFNWPALPVAMTETIVPDFPWSARASISPTPATTCDHRPKARQLHCLLNSAINRVSSGEAPPSARGARMPGLQQPLYQMKADFFKTLGHPVRIRVLELLSEREHAVSEMLTEIGIEPANLSQQLSILRRAGLVTGRREGLSVTYELTSSDVAALLATARAILTGVAAGQVEALEQPA